ncbi:PHA/PHB synthase family protein [Desulfoscipio gibsoniae]|uniref:Poly(3-hydroxyalkanoate) polymerase subunit PhaC n=1 Tax=Desulfoscipio gibsoniae DSM 7213 TaxID=767817 RepID=R4KJX6_9FIRM|nr:class III poly(R)-hydroxyalkanoic acid synthase subunit PhaC [Desulfoscipio gibsoniae]AGL02934.1 poly(R)-hydroxyalkanoic acid synthase, class III, PhaC subunit [Desulfoscipio gibsoniae DSM 7213]
MSSYFSNPSEQMAKQFQQGWEKATETTQKWFEIIKSTPSPQVGLTPKDIIWRKNKAQLYHYQTTTPKIHRIPILIIYALINKPYILDIAPETSLVKYLVDNGFDVFMIDWGTPDLEDQDLSFNELVLDYIPKAVAKIVQTSCSNEITILGYCMGGTIASMYTALHPQPRIKNMLFIATPIDFEEAGLSSVYIKQEEYNVDKIVDTFGIVPKSFINTSVFMLNPVNNYWGTYSRLWKMLHDDLSPHSWMLLNKWINDPLPFAGEAYRQWLGLYKTNKLVKKEFELRGRIVDLANINSSILILGGTSDHIVLPEQARALLDHVSSQDKTYLEFPVGHGGLVFGSQAVKKVYPAIKEWLEKRSGGDIA